MSRDSGTCQQRLPPQLSLQLFGDGGQGPQDPFQALLVQLDVLLRRLGLLRPETHTGGGEGVGMMGSKG